MTDQDELPLQGCKHMYRKEGIKGMFQGNGTNCVRIVPNSAVKFLAYEQISRYSLHNPLMLQHAGYSMQLYIHVVLLSWYLADLTDIFHCLQHQHQAQPEAVMDACTS